MKKFRRFIFLPMIAFILLSFAGVPGLATGSPADSGWILVWSDEFEGAGRSALDKDKWNCDMGAGWGAIHELQFYTDQPANVSRKNGNLVIRAIKQPEKGYSYTSARVQTRGKFQFKYGRIEARMKLPCARGVVPGLMLFGNSGDPKARRESGRVSIAYSLGYEPSVVYGTVEGPGYTGIKSPWKSYTLSRKRTITEDYHIYALEWEAGILRWSVDGIRYHTLTQSALPAGGKWVFDRPCYIVIQLPVGGLYSGDPDRSTRFPQTIAVDYIRVYRRR